MENVPFGALALRVICLKFYFGIFYGDHFTIEAWSADYTNQNQNSHEKKLS